MKTKYFVFFIILSLILTISGCKKETASTFTTEIKTSTKTENLLLKNMKIELDKMLNDIPDEYNEDIYLYDSYKFTTKYNVYGTEIINGYLKYLNTKGNYNITLEIILSYNGITVKGSKTITSLMNEHYYDDIIDERLGNVIDDYKKMLPISITSDFKLPTYSIENTIVNINPITKLNFESSYYEYPMLENDSIFELKIEAIDKESKRSVKEIINIPIINMNDADMVPKMYLFTENAKNITSKEEYITGNLSLYEKDTNNNLVKTLDNETLKIKGRGNSTWGFSKKPYKIKFDSKISLFGEEKAKEWVLLANYTDHTLIRNYLAYSFGKSLINLEFSPCAHFVDLYLNGVYQGNYMITDQIEVSSSRVNIEEKSSNTDTGYLIEMDLRLMENSVPGENSSWFKIKVKDRELSFEIKSPNPEKEYYSVNQLEYIKSYLESTFNCLINKGDIEKYIDLNSAVDWFIVSELFKNVDSGFSSCYMYKKENGLLYFGPIWDFDLSALNQGHLDDYNRSKDGWYTSQYYKNFFYYYLMKDSRFTSLLKKRWKEIRNKEIIDLINSIDSIVSYIQISANKNFDKWDVIGKYNGWYTSTEVKNAKTYRAQVELLKKWFYDRINWIDNNIDKL